jgi:hypothetical protein
LRNNKFTVLPNCVLALGAVLEELYLGENPWIKLDKEALQKHFPNTYIEFD